MELAKKVMAIFLAVMTIVWAEATMANGEVYKVGDSAGWTTIANVDYHKWASSKIFQVGDTILFEYNEEKHNVMEVSHADFRTCNTAAPIRIYTSTGNNSITIKSPGHYYFICGAPGHCEAGQKVDIRVLYLPKTSPTLSPMQSAALPDDLMAPSPSPAMSKATSNVKTKWAGLSVIAIAMYVYYGWVYLLGV